jgi:hypothetical protein
VKTYNLVRVTIYSVGGEREYDLKIKWQLVGRTEETHGESYSCVTSSTTNFT